jgi:hypothetical protein
MFFEKALTETAGLLYAVLSLAALAFVIKYSQNTAQVMQAGSSSFANLIGAATFQNSGAVGWSGFSQGY